MEVLNTISFTDCLVEIVIAAPELTKDVLSGPWALNLITIKINQISREPGGVSSLEEFSFKFVTLKA
jgi:hypothetical protein